MRMSALLGFAAALHLLGLPAIADDAPTVVAQTGHRAAVNAVSFSPDGKLLASGGGDGRGPGRIILWDIDSQKQLRTLSGHDNRVTSLSFSPDGKRLASTGDDGALKLWDVGSGKLSRSVATASDRLAAVEFSPDGERLATAGGAVETAGRVTLREVAGLTVVQTLTGHPTPVGALCFSPDGKYLATAGGDLDTRGKIVVWKLGRNRRYRTLSGHIGAIASIRFGPEGKLLASAGRDRTVRLWDVERGKERRRFDKQTASLSAVDLSPDGKLVAWAGADMTIGLGETDGEGAPRILKWHARRITSLRFSPDGKLLASGSADKTVKLWSVRDARETGRLAGSSPRARALVFSPDSSHLAVGTDAGVKLWDLARARLVRSFAADLRGIATLAFSPDGGALAVGAHTVLRPGEIKLYDPATGNAGPQLEESKAAGPAAALDPAGKLVAAGDRAGAVRLWEGSQGKAAKTFQAHVGAINALSFAPKGGLLASGGSDGTARLWEASAGKQVYLLRGHVGAVGTLAFSLDGKLLATGGADGSARLWTVADGKPAAILPEHAGAVTTLAFRPDGKALATGDEAGVRLWELPAGKLLRVLAGGAAAALAYSPDGKFLASTGADGTTRVWSATDGEELVRLIATDGLGSLVVTPQNHYASWRAGHEAVALRVGDRALALEPFALKLARRDLVLERLGLVANDDLAVKRWVYRQRLQEMRFSEDVLRQGFRVPRLALRSNGLPARTKQRRLKLKVRASDGEFRLDRLCVAINQVPVLGANGIDLRPRQRKLVDVALNLELTPGANRIEMSVFNEKGVESPRVSLAVECTAPKRRPKLWLVAIGVSRFKEAAYDLTCAAADANAIAGLPELDSAKSPFESVFDQVEVLGLADSLASRRDIRQAREFLEKAGVDDVAIVFAAGHSLFDEQQDYYYASHDIDFDQLPKWGLKFTELDRLLDGIPARRKLLLLDVSVPGTLPADAEPGEPVRLFQDGSGLDLPEGAIVSSRAFGATPMELRLARAFQSELLAGPGFGSGAAVIAACGAAEYRVEHGDAKSGVLAQALLECLTQLKGDTNKDGLLRVAELRNYLAKRVPQLTKGGQVVAARVNPASDFAVAGK